MEPVRGYDRNRDFAKWWDAGLTDAEKADPKNWVTLDEVQAIACRIGLTPEARLQWVLDFTARDLTSSSPQERENLRREFLAFQWAPRSHYAPRAKAQYVAAMRERYDTHRKRAAVAVERATAAAKVQRKVVSVPVLTLPPFREVAAAQAVFTKVFEMLERDNRVVLSFECMLGSLPADLPGEPPRAPGYRVLDFGTAGTGLEVLATLLSYEPTIRRCPDPKCGRRFVVQRVGQRYCSRRCQSRGTTRTYREKHQPSAARRRPGRPRKQT
jgi:hypothetical protein